MLCCVDLMSLLIGSCYGKGNVSKDHKVLKERVFVILTPATCLIICLSFFMMPHGFVTNSYHS